MMLLLLSCVSFAFPLLLVSSHFADLRCLFYLALSFCPLAWLLLAAVLLCCCPLSFPAASLCAPLLCHEATLHSTSVCSAVLLFLQQFRLLMSRG